MVRPAGQKNGQLLVVPALLENLLIFGLDGVAVGFLGSHCGLEGLVRSKPVEANVAEIFPNLLFQEFFILEVDGGRIDGNLGIGYAFDDVGVPGNHRAVVAV